MKNRFSYLLLAVATLFVGCKQKYKKTTDGTEYMVISKGGKKAVKGNSLEINITALYKVSVLYSTRELGMPQYGDYDTAQFPPTFKAIFKEIAAGDSIIMRISTDSLIKKGQAAPFMKKGQYIYQYFKIENVFTTVEQKDSAVKSHMAEAKNKSYQKMIGSIQKELVTNAPQLKIDDKILADYIAAHNITAKKSDWGTYVVITEPGTGAAIDNNSVAIVNYTGKTLKDTVFDSNVDPKFSHVEPFAVDMSQFRVIPGWIDGLKQMKKGAKGTFLIPSSLAYGKNGSGQKIGPNENLAFDIEILDVVSAEQYEAEQTAKQQKAMEEQQKQMEAMKNKQQNATPPAEDPSKK